METRPLPLPARRRASDLRIYVVAEVDQDGALGITGWWRNIRTGEEGDRTPLKLRSY